MNFILTSLWLIGAAFLGYNISENIMHGTGIVMAAYFCMIAIASRVVLSLIYHRNNNICIV